MRSLLTIVGVILVVLGIAILGYKGFTYTSKEKVAEIGNISVTVDQDKHVYFQPMTGVLALAAGIILVVVGRRK
jgi:hypothetical protein